jgi:hypothetical protein
MNGAIRTALVTALVGGLAVVLTGTSARAATVVGVYQPVQDEAANTTKVQGYEQWYYQGYRETAATPSTDPAVDGPLQNLSRTSDTQPQFAQWSWSGVGVFDNPRIFASAGDLVMLSERSGPSAGNWTIGASVLAWEVPAGYGGGSAAIDYDYDLPGTTALVDWFLVLLQGGTRTVLLSGDDETGDDGGSNISYTTDFILSSGDRIELWVAPGRYNAVNDQVRLQDTSTVTFRVPEPASVLLLGIAGLTVLRRRRG